MKSLNPFAVSLFHLFKELYIKLDTMYLYSRFLLELTSDNNNHKEHIFFFKETEVTDLDVILILNRIESIKLVLLTLSTLPTLIFFLFLIFIMVIIINPNIVVKTKFYKNTTYKEIFKNIQK